VKAQIGPKGRRLQLGRHAIWMAPLVAIGVVLAGHLPAAAGDSIPPLPTVSVPTLPLPPVSVPQVTPTTTAAPTSPPPDTSASSTTGTTTTAAAATNAAAVARPQAAVSAVAGSRALANGAISIPVSSVRPPARLVVLVAVAAQKVHGSRNAIPLNVQVTDTRGYLVRGADVGLRAVPTGALTGLVNKRSPANGKVGFVVAVPAGGTHDSVLLVVHAADPLAPKLAAAARTIRIARPA
jgi:hypothetical protein